MHEEGMREGRNHDVHSHETRSYEDRVREPNLGSDREHSERAHPDREHPDREHPKYTPKAPTVFEELQAQLHIRFTNLSLLRQAFTHASYRNEHRKPHIQDNERLEFLGDAVLELVVSEHLYRAYPLLPEGELTRLRAAMVCEPSLVHYGRRLEFQRYIRLGKGEERSGGRNRPALLADVFEAFIGALYLDQGFSAAETFIATHVIPFFHEEPSLIDYKTRLQEFVQQQLGKELRYAVIAERGPAHAREFHVQVTVGGEAMGDGVGKSKKEAEQKAASMALSKLKPS